MSRVNQPNDGAHRHPDGGGSQRPQSRVGGLIGGFHVRTLVEWLLLTLLVVALALSRSHFDWGKRLDRAIYDVGIAAQPHAARPDIVIVAIDDRSLQGVGRWPWRRAVLADLIDRVSAGGAAVIGVDVLLVEPDRLHPDDDRMLAASIARAGNVVLPAMADPVPGGYRIRYPLPELRAAVGHINITLDSDGLARHIWLREGRQGEWLDHLVVRMIQIGKAAQPLSRYRAEDVREHADGGWERQYRLRIPFAGPPGTFTTLSALDLMNGAVPGEALRGKTVLIGAVATGLGDMFAAPMSRRGDGISGVELLANATQTLLDDQGIVALPAAAVNAMTAAAILLGCLAALLLSPRNGLVANAALLVALLLLSVLLLGAGRLWFSPVSAMLGCMLFYPLWSWRRQEWTLAFLSREARRLEGESPLPGAARTAPPAAGQTLDTRMTVLYRMIQRLRDMRRFLSDGLESLPDATLICDPQGTVLLANARALAMAPRTLAALPPDPVALAAAGRAAEAVPGPQLAAVMAEIIALPQPALDYWQRLRATAGGDVPGAEPAADLARERGGVELQTRDQRAVLVRGAPLRGDAGGVEGFSISFVDITQVRLAERQREETLRFISHDMRSPQASILALVELQADPERALEPAVLMERIRHHAGRTLALADDFIQLARAESQHLRFVETDLATVLMDAADALWALAHARHIKVSLEISPEEMTLQAEPMLLMRAVCNLLDNAIKYSPAGTTVTLRAARETVASTVAAASGRDAPATPVSPGAALRISISDQGPGIPQHEQARIFQPFSRLQGEGRPVRDGSGLGLVFVKTVIERHGGQIAVHSEPGAGATFDILLPN
ncbi:CHASE2 domain-containing protein [Cupriavidus sp. AU9028]|uniref:CHASE2 domain-containing protein n=1 Tax=Cupriavidus sp. AU9028 TaxID=2871157 RepID=UPI001C947F54|nr:CHASE2 domain-containing protein [Cupriavidus sp. AU9028]MBY4897920.1 CHASE2 domain-containing protein [Cupriavidus sp. AU9028]